MGKQEYVAIIRHQLEQIDESDIKFLRQIYTLLNRRLKRAKLKPCTPSGKMNVQG